MSRPLPLPASGAGRGSCLWPLLDVSVYLLGMKEAIVQSLISANFKQCTGKNFGLNPFHIAVIKQNIGTVKMFCELIFDDNSRPFVQEKNVLHSYRTMKDSSKVKIEFISILELCVKTNNVQLLTTILRSGINFRGVEKAFAYSLKHGLDE